MKTLKFSLNLVNLVLSGKKTTTWRLWDDKDLQMGDEIFFLNSNTKEEFAKAELTKVVEKPFKDLTDDDWQGHERFQSDKEMYRSYSDYYGRGVDRTTLIKIIHFELIKPKSSKLP